MLRWLSLDIVAGAHRSRLPQSRRGPLASPRPFRSAPTELKDLKESANPNRPSVGETGALDSLDACLHIFVHYFPDVNRQQNA